MVKMYDINQLKKMKSEPMLSEFWKYCIDHQGERFWQALRNFSGAGVIFVAEGLDITDDGYEYTNPEDTFFWENKDN